MIRLAGISGKIYLATSPSGKRYVGQTIKPLSRRKVEHRNAARNPKEPGYRSPIARAIRKYGFENITWEILERGITSHEALDARECYWIDKLQTHGPGGYNRTDGGGGCSGRKVSEETRHKISESNRKTKADPEVKVRMSESARQAMADPERRARQSESLRKTMADPEWKARASAALAKYPLVLGKYSVVSVLRHLAAHHWTHRQLWDLVTVLDLSLPIGNMRNNACEGRHGRKYQAPLSFAERRTLQILVRRYRRSKNRGFHPQVRRTLGILDGGD